MFFPLRLPAARKTPLRLEDTLNICLREILTDIK